MNDVDFPYVVLRNWENLPDGVQLGEHSDLDLLVYSLDHWTEIFPNATRTYPSPRVQFKLPIGKTYIYVDVRSIGDRYYPRAFQEAILETRQETPKGFYIPAKELFLIALGYHAVHHKNYVSDDYKRWLGDASIEDLLSALKDSGVGWVEPVDPTVGRFNQYFKGATSTVERKNGKVIKKQTAYSDYSLIENECRILSKCSSRHFPQVKFNHQDCKMEHLEIEDCGEMVTAQKLPPDWRKQLVEIIQDLRAHAVEHRDITPNNLMVKDGVIKLIDFGWARLKDDPPDRPPMCLGEPYKASWGWDDNFSMKKVIKEFEYQAEEAEQYAHTGV